MACGTGTLQSQNGVYPPNPFTFKKEYNLKMAESYNEVKYKLCDLVDFFYKHYKDQKLSWFDSVFKEMEKLRKQIENEEIKK